MIEIKRLSNKIEADLLKAYFEDNGIHIFTKNDDAGGNLPFLRTSSHSRCILYIVNHEQHQEALDLLKAFEEDQKKYSVEPREDYTLDNKSKLMRSVYATFILGFILPPAFFLLFYLCYRVKSSFPDLSKKEKSKLALLSLIGFAYWFILIVLSVLVGFSYIVDLIVFISQTFQRVFPTS